MHRFIVACAVSLAVVSIATHPSVVDACAIAFDPARGAPRIAGEEALIVWDEQNHIEHFVRSARFDGVTSSFAFLVPTPSRPELAEADDQVFARLARLYLRPAPVRRSASGQALRGRLAAGAAVTIVEQARVAGLDATVLSATDSAALATWLRTHGYASRPNLDAWLAPYVQRGFYITAFRYDPATQTSITSHAVRLSFATQQPFYPYAEPSDGERVASRRLRLSVVAPWRVDAHEGTRRWRARVGFASDVGTTAELLNGTLPSNAVTGSWITTFEDAPSRRGRYDLIFQRARRQQPVPPSIEGTIGAPL